jgi:hypothetical protein
MKTKMKTHHALCGLLSGLLLLAAGTAQTHAGLLVPAAHGAQLYVGNYNINTIEKFTTGGVGSALPVARAITTASRLTAQVIFTRHTWATARL